jgi:hypothetical protein
MIKLRGPALAVAAGLVLAPMAAFAAPITYTISGTMSGSLGDASFSNAAVTYTGVGDTSNVSFVSLPQSGLVPFVALSSLTVSIAGVGTVHATDAFAFFNNQAFATAGFTDLTILDDVFDVTADALASWDGLSAIGPLDVTDNFLADFPTDGGTLDITSADLSLDAAEGTGAIPVSEPASAALLGVALTGLAVIRRRKTA